MLFSSLLFVYLFLPLCLIIYFLAGSTNRQNTVLLVFSLFFYAWGEPKYVLLLIGMTFADWLLALFIEKKRSTAWAGVGMFAACAVSIGLIGVFKYGSFFCENLHALIGVPEIIPQIALPIGISFYTFQLLSYVADVYRGEVAAQKRFDRLLMYASLFHQCVAGPIVRYSDVEKEILHRTTTPTEVARGVSRFAVGLCKKTMLANPCGSLADMLLLSDDILADPELLTQNLQTLSSRPALGLWIGVLAYALQIYLDFSAYSDMAIGMGLMIGFHYRENFDYPYMSRSVTEFWRRWHISLGAFFRDYVYIPLGGSRRGRLRTIVNMFVVWALTGLWHGASWNFVLWGLYFFVLLSFEKLFFKRVTEKLPRVFSHIYLLAAVYFGWILFKFRDLAFVKTVFMGMFGLNGNSFSSYETSLVAMGNIVFIAVAVIACTPLVRNFLSRQYKKAMGMPYRRGAVAAVDCVLPLAMLLLSTMALAGNSYNPFIYFQF